MKLAAAAVLTLALQGCSYDSHGKPVLHRGKDFTAVGKILGCNDRTFKGEHVREVYIFTAGKEYYTVPVAMEDSLQVPYQPNGKDLEIHYHDRGDGLYILDSIKETK